MLSENQLKYLSTIPDSKAVSIFPYSEAISVVANETIKKIENAVPELIILFIGASALKISGQNDIDINILAPKNDFDKYLPKIIEVLGEPTFKGSSIEWTSKINGYEQTVYLTDANSKGLQEQIEVFNILRDNPALLKEYENIKEQMNGGSYREYQKNKYEFYNKILKRF